VTEEYNVMVTSEEEIGTTEYLTLCTKCRVNRRRYNWVLLCVCVFICVCVWGGGDLLACNNVEPCGWVKTF
jgi:hypothetical protein